MQCEHFYFYYYSFKLLLTYLVHAWFCKNKLIFLHARTKYSGTRFDKRGNNAGFFGVYCSKKHLLTMFNIWINFDFDFFSLKIECFGLKYYFIHLLVIELDRKERTSPKNIMERENYRILTFCSPKKKS
jgi:hypothetical protein